MQSIVSPSVSIVLPTFNRERFLAQAFESIAAQHCTDWELVVVDDGSTDDTRAVVEHLQRGLTQPVRYIYQDNRGAYGARNTGITHGVGEFVAFYDSDDLWLPHHLSDCLAGFRQNPELDWVWGSCQRIDYATGRVLTENSFFVDGKPRQFLRAKTRLSGRLHIIEDRHTVEYQMLHGLYCGLQNSMIRRRVFESLRFCEKNRVVEDELFLLRALANGARVAYYREPHFIYRVHEDNSSASSKEGRQQKMLPIFRELVAGLELLPSEVSLTRRQRRALRRRLSLEDFWHIGYHGLWLAGQRDDALATFRRAMSLWPWDPAFWRAYVLALARLYTGQMKSSES